MRSAIDFYHTFGLFKAKDTLKAAPFETTHIASDDDGLYYVRKNDQGLAIFNKPHQEWWGLGLTVEGDLYDICEVKNLVESFALVRSIGPDRNKYISGERLNYWMNGLKYSQDQILRALGLVKVLEAV